MTEAQTEALAEIHQRLAACTQAGDARKAEAYAACFAREGILELVNETIAGRTAILAWMKAPSVIPPSADGAAGFISHHLTTCHVDFTGPDSATVRTYWLVTSATGLDHNGYYIDKLVREEGEWLIAHRRPRTLWINAQSVLHAGN
ncbi:nuclear transport factor 2 family protein [Novosphingobium mangrovi (ex Huang et al. 2023)]|uniref:Nuclear transport factor 2 family protein n=1 Tax=Novosphingobium mangrovi (ex Huang et al. 2023) TaxID=2976432 RepID=A0ABT2I2R2_9SPHN|nr:nuclear transport factor 2 family protein [Novosphingobium mangrovi (ex Huang et al. 2023)]MCT2399089.1 nuclear transport factor 2 family protein [Novosphingobium mangrovi (ex Huang et al. 2023)]